MNAQQTREGTPRRRVIVTTAFAVVGAIGLYIWRTPLSAGVFLACTVCTLLLVPHIARWATRRRVLALPGGRDLHRRPTPRAGGVALFLPVAATLLCIALLGDARAWGLLIGSSLVFGCGLWDDVKHVGPKYKVLFQLLAGGALILSGTHIQQLSTPVRR